MKILHSKLLCPRIEETILRQGFDPLREEILKKRITTVTAGAGYGKTTFVAQTTSGTDTAWYRLSDSDRDFAVFLNYLTEGVGAVYPRFKDEMTGDLKDDQLPGYDSQAVITSFVHLLEQIVDRDIVIVLDDFHMVQGNRELIQCVQFMVEHLPSFVHMVIISRTHINLSLSRLRAMREVVDITENNLVFSPREVCDLFGRVFGMEISMTTAEVIHFRSQGWVAGLILLYHAIRGKSDVDIQEFFLRLQGSGRTISEYLEENVFTQLPQETRKFLLKTSVLSRLNSHLCNRFLDVQDAGSILSFLEKNHLFTFSLDDAGQEYAYHHLFQDFLRSRLAGEYTGQEIAELNRMAAIVFEEQGMNEEAIHHYLKAGAFEKATRVLSTAGIKMVMEGRIKLIGSFLESLPQEISSCNPWLVYIRALIAGIVGLPRDARDLLLRAREMFEEQGQQFGVDLCGYDLGNIYYTQGYFKDAQEQYLRILHSPTCSPDISRMLLAQLIFITAYQGKFDDADRYYQQGMDTLRYYLPDKAQREEIGAWYAINYSIRFITSGDFQKAIAMGEAARKTLLKYQSFRLLAFCYTHISRACHLAGLFSKGLENARAGLNLVKEKGFRDASLGWLLMGCCCNLLGMNKITEALNYGEEAMKCFRDLESIYGEATVCIPLYVIHLRMGDMDAAEETILHGIRLLETIDFPMAQAELKLGLALIKTMKGNAAEAELLLEEAEENSPPYTTFRFWVSCVKTGIATLQGRQEDSLKHLRACLIISRNNEYDTWIINMFILLFVPMAELFERGEMRAYLTSILRKMDPGLKETLVWLEKSGPAEVSRACKIILDELPLPPPPDLDVQCLNRFRLHRGGEEIPARSWTSKKARMLFKLLVYYRPRGFVNKEVFMEHLWPEEDPQKTAKRFHVALATLRKVLEPYGSRGGSSSYIQSDSDSYFLDIGAGGRVDVEDFESACAQAEATVDSTEALRHLLRAEEVYQGDLLEEDLFEPWCISERERLKEKFLSVLASIAEYYELKKDFHHAAEYCGKYLAEDAYAEDMYQQLMRCHAHLGNKALVKKTFERCRRNIVDDLGYPLNRETELLLKELTSEGDSDAT